MSETAAATATATETAPKAGGMMQFRRSNRNATPLPKASAARQGAIAQLAFRMLGGRDGALEFLNADNDQLGGRPIDLATASDSGFAEVETEILRLTTPPTV